MTTPTGTIGLQDVQTEFGGSDPIEINEYYAGGSYVPEAQAGIPASGVITLDDFRGKTKLVYSISVSINPNTGTYPYTSTVTWTSNLPISGKITVNITYPNGSTGQLTNQAVNGSTTISWGSTTGTGTAYIYLTGYNSESVLLATSSTVQATVIAPSTYAFGTIPSSINEGSSGTFNVTTANVANGTTLYWTINNTSTAAADFAASSGSFTITSNAGSFSINPTADSTTEGAETFTVSIRTGSTSGTIVATSASVTVNDTSTTPVPTYAFGTVPSSINEGSSGTFNVTTANVANGTTLYWTINNTSTAAADFAASSGSFTITSNAGSFSINPTADSTTEGAETFTVSIRTGSTSGTIVATTASVTVNDTSITPATYAFTTTPTSINEGSAGTFTVTGTNVPGGNATLYWTINYVGTTTSADFVATSGSFTMTNSVGSFSITPTADITTEGTETFTVSIRTGSISGTVQTTSSPVTTINDTSVATYSVTASATSVNEGSSFTITFATNQSGSFPYVISGSINRADINNAALSGSAANGTVITYTVTADTLTEGSEVFIITYNSSASTTVNIIDTSLSPSTYAFGTIPSSINEGSSGTFNVNTTNVANGTTLYWAIANATTSDSDFSAANGSFSINSNTGSFIVSPRADVTTEGAETFRVTIRSGSIAGPILATSNLVTVNDTSLAPTYAFGTIPSSINEGSSGTFNVNTANVANSTTLYWTINNTSTAAADFAASSGSFTITSNAGSFSINPTADSTTEGAQTFTVSIRTGSTSGTIVATSASVTVNDTSVAIIPSFTSASASPTSAYNTVNIVISWTTTNASSVNISINNPSGSNIVNQTVGTNTSYTYNGNAAASIGQYTVTLRATSSTGNTATRTVNWTYTSPPPSFSATYNSFTPVQDIGTTVAFSQANNNIVINGNDQDNVSSSGTATYTTTGTGYLYCFLYIDTEKAADYAYFQFDGTTITNAGSPGAGSPYSKNAQGGYSGGPGYIIDNLKIGPINAGTHTIKIIYTKDFDVPAYYVADIVSGAWTWSAT